MCSLVRSLAVARKCVALRRTEPRGVACSMYIIQGLQDLIVMYVRSVSPDLRFVLCTEAVRYSLRRVRARTAAGRTDAGRH